MRDGAIVETLECTSLPQCQRLRGAAFPGCHLGIRAEMPSGMDMPAEKLHQDAHVSWSTAVSRLSSRKARICWRGIYW